LGDGYQPVVLEVFGFGWEAGIRAESGERASRSKPGNVLSSQRTSEASEVGWVFGTISATGSSMQSENATF
jgi:hypothetical protein